MIKKKLWEQKESTIEPSDMSDLHEHQHGEYRGRKASVHGDHIDYVHEGHSHRIHGNQIDESEGTGGGKTDGNVKVVDDDEPITI